MSIVVNLLVLTVVIFIVANVMPGIRLKDFGTGIKVAVVFSIINFVIGWLLVFLSLPFIVLTLGLFIFVINALLLMLTDYFLEDFEMDGFFTALIASVLISIGKMVLHWIF